MTENVYPRYLLDVIDTMLARIPEDHPVVGPLKSARQSAVYSAPELMWLR